MIPFFNECADKMIEKLKPIGDGTTPVFISEEFTLFTINVISKVWSLCVKCTYVLCMVIHYCTYDFVSIFRSLGLIHLYG